MTNAGIYIANTYESVISGNTMAVYGAIGIQATGTTLNSLCIVGNHIDTASQQAVYLNCTGVGNIITGNTFSDNGYTSSGPTYYPDITVGSGTGLLNTVVVGNNFRHFPSGPWYASINIQVYGNQTTVIGNTMDYAQTDGIDLNGCSNCIVKGNIIQNCSAYAIKELNSANYNSIEGNTLVSVTNTILKVGSATVIRNNVGYATESSGSSTGTGSQQSIAHGLVAVPTSVSIVPTASGATVSFAYADATNIYVTVTSGTAFNWRASV
jgi:parallel beta-helix repeat protein